MKYKEMLEELLEIKLGIEINTEIAFVEFIKNPRSFTTDYQVVEKVTLLKEVLDQLAGR